MIIAPEPFRGEVPRLESHLLPPDCAQQAIDCEFSGGSLSPLRSGQLLRAMASNPVRGIYTEDGLLFYTWPLETLAFRSPVIDDTLGRMYFMQPAVGTFNVATTSQMDVSGPSPSGNVWAAGVPQPAIAPSLSIVDRTTLPDYTNVAVSATAWWESAGTQYGAGAVTLTKVSAFKNYTFAAPAKPSGTPDDAVLACKFTLADASNSNSLIMTITAQAGSNGSSPALPGTVEMALTTDGVTGTLAFTWGIAYTSAVVYTNLNTWGEESAPSPPATTAWTYLQDIKIGVSASSFAGYKPFGSYRVYRTYGTDTTYLQANTTTINSTTFQDGTRAPLSTGLPLQSQDWSVPPTGLQGGCQMPNGWFVMFKGDVLYLSEPYRPYAFPYSVTVRGNIRGVCAARGGCVVTTTMGVCMLVGDFPNGARIMELDMPQPGIAQRSMTNIEGAVAYASQDGLVLVAGASASMDMSQKLFTRGTWRNMYGALLADASLRLSYQGGYLVATSNTQPLGFILKLDEDVGQLSRLDFSVDAAFQLPVTNTLYYSQGASVYEFRGGATNLPADWWSKDFSWMMETSFGAGYIRCDGPVRLTVYVDGSIWYDTDADVLRGADPALLTGGAGLTTGSFRLPGGLEGLRWSVRLRTAYKVYEFRIAGTFDELRQSAQFRSQRAMMGLA